ncbi:hypothetical protein RJ639_024435 [Escallonia herrerae]|uniref:Uncharacterized protein n=1 Tax=Escallonia herrerae TaxID=1293975 RepID=A0AA88V317_9ASTE|nr:hypothetical protein RJ639_024435 [Escallonia herrerae]
MALSLLVYPYPSTFSRPSPFGGRRSQSVPCMAIAITGSSCDHPIIARRSANYHPSIWEDDYVQSLSSNYVGETHIERAVKLKEDVRMMLDKLEEEAPLHRLELIDTVQRLGISYHFGFEIKKILESIYHCDHRSSRWNQENLYAIALEFRLLRQHGYEVPQEVFRRFTDETGTFKAGLCEETRGILYLYEATYLSIAGESILDEARDFTTKHLKESLNDKNIDQNLAMLVRHSLELPLHWRMLRLEACWFIHAYGRSKDMNSNLLDLAKLDFNMVQAVHQDDLKHMSRWWKSTRLGEKMTFSRDRLMENFLWTVGVIFEPEFQYFRRMSTKVNSLVTTIDDLYDVYGTLEELELFTNAVERWDVNEMERVPDYMRICFLALYNSINEMAYDTIKERGFNTIPYLKNAWTDLCKCYLLEAKWYKSGYTPTLEEYINNAWISISAPVILTHAYFFADNPTTEESLAYLEKYPNIIRWSSMILRLSDDLGTSQDELQRGDNPKSIQCYMHETGASEEDAREHIRHLISETWKKMNADRVASSLFNQTFIGAAINLARMAQFMYQHGDGHGIEDRETKERVLSLLINPIPLGSTDPELQYFWRMSTKVNSQITTIDDLYDVYGTLEEIEFFTNVVERWDVNEMERVPDYMRICFLALYNRINEMAYDTLKERGFNIIPYLKNTWADLCKSYLLEAKWYKSGYVPTLEEYINNAWISIAAPVMLMHAYFFVENPITKELCQHLADELQRGDNPKSIQCYMHETSASEEDARKHIRHLISETWKKMNEDRVAGSLFNQTFIGAAINLARMAQCMYQHGDGHGIEDGETKERVLSLLINPIPLGSTDV